MMESWSILFFFMLTFHVTIGVIFGLRCLVEFHESELLRTSLPIIGRLVLGAFSEKFTFVEFYRRIWFLGLNLSLIDFCFRYLYMASFVMNHGAFTAWCSDLFCSVCSLFICVFDAWLDANDAYSMIGLMNWLNRKILVFGLRLL